MIGNLISQGYGPGQNSIVTQGYAPVVEEVVAPISAPGPSPIVAQGYDPRFPNLIITQGYGNVGGAGLPTIIVPPTPTPAIVDGGGIRRKPTKTCVVVQVLKTSPDPETFGFEKICWDLRDDTKVSVKGPEVVDLSDRQVTAIEVIAGELVVHARIKEQDGD